MQITKQFERIGKKAPQAAGYIDTLALLRQSIFGKRAGDMKLASLGLYYGLGIEQHRRVYISYVSGGMCALAPLLTIARGRSIEDVRMNIEVFKKVALTLFLEGAGIVMHNPEQGTPRTASRKL